MKKTKKALASLAIAGMVLSMAPMSVFGADATNRISDLDRVGTAIAIANNGWAAGADSVIVVPADDANIVDALAAAPLAGQLNAPILVTYKGALDAKVQQKIVDLGAKNVYAIGALSDDVVNSLKAISGVTVEQLQGADRTETAAKVAAKLTKVNGTFVVAYDGKADALSAASFAAANSYSIVIANPDGTIPSNEAAYKVAPTYTVGGQVTVEGATALAGADRYATNNEVLDGLEFNYDKVYVANGQSLVDALAGAPLAAQTDSPIVLADSIGVATAANDDLTSSSAVIALGGTGAVSDSVLAKVAYQAPATLEVESVSATNLIQVAVTFSSDNWIDEDEVKDASNYTFEDNDGDELTDEANNKVVINDVAVNENVVTLTLKVPVKQQTEAVLTVSDAILAEDTDFDVEFLDTKLPKAVSAQVVGNDTIKVVFDEPIKTAPKAEFKVEDGDLFVKNVTFANNNTEVNVELYSDLENGTVALEVGTNVEDYAGFGILKSTFTVDVVEDTEAPVVVGYKDAKPEGVTLVFNEDIEIADGDKANFYHTNTNAANQVKDNVTAADVDGNELFLDFSDSNLPEGKAYIYIEKESLNDLWDNENAKISYAIEVTIDATAPELDKLEVKTEKQVKLTFSEALDKDSAEKEANYTILDKDGKEVTGVVSKAVRSGSDNDIVTIDFDEELNGDYSIVIEDVEDLAGNAIAKTTKAFLVDDKTAPVFGDFTATIYNKSAKDQLVKIDFDQEMTDDGSYSIKDLSKYSISEGGKTYDLSDLDAEATIAVVDDGTAVEITIPSTKDDATDGIDLTDAAVLTVGRVADVAGNYTVALSGNVDVDDQSNVTIKSVVATADDTIVVTFDDQLTKVYDDDITLTNGTDTLSIAKATSKINADGNTVFTFTLADDEGPVGDDSRLTFDGMYNSKVVYAEVIGEASENVYGETLKTGATANLEDEIVPALVERDYKAVANSQGADETSAYKLAKVEGADNKVTLFFEEALDFNTISNVSFAISKFDVVNVAQGNDASEVVITVKPNKDNKNAELDLGTVVTQKASIKDVAGNTLEGFTEEIALYTGGIAPTATVSTGSATKLVVKVYGDADTVTLDADTVTAAPTLVFDSAVDATVATFNIGGAGAIDTETLTFTVTDEEGNSNQYDAEYDLDTDVWTLALK